MDEREKAFQEAAAELKQKKAALPCGGCDYRCLPDEVRCFLVADFAGQLAYGVNIRGGVPTLLMMLDNYEAGVKQSRCPNAEVIAQVATRLRQMLQA